MRYWVNWGPRGQRRCGPSPRWCFLGLDSAAFPGSLFPPCTADRPRVSPRASAGPCTGAKVPHAVPPNGRCVAPLARPSARSPARWTIVAPLAQIGLRRTSVVTLGGRLRGADHPARRVGLRKDGPRLMHTPALALPRPAAAPTPPPRTALLRVLRLSTPPLRMAPTLQSLRRIPQPSAD